MIFLNKVTLIKDEIQNGMKYITQIINVRLKLIFLNILT